MKACPKIGMLVLALVLASGCGKGGKSIEDYFWETQGQTVTPHGKIKKASIRSLPGDKIQYETEGGAVFQVTLEKQEYGYRYSAPERLK